MHKSTIFNYETLVHAISGATGSMFAMSLVYPLDNVKFRIQLDTTLTELSTIQTLIRVLNEEGIEALYRGLDPCLKSLGISNFVYFYVFRALKSIPLNDQQESAKRDLVYTTIAGVINVLLTNPLSVVHHRLKIKKQNNYTGLLDGLWYIARTEGISSLWSSVGPSLLLVINPAINFTVYEALKRRFKSQNALQFFLIGALSKMIATTLTYPLQLVQSRQRYNSAQKNTLKLIMEIVKKEGPEALYKGLEAKLMQTVFATAVMFMSYEKIVQYVFSILMQNKRKI